MILFEVFGVFAILIGFIMPFIYDSIWKKWYNPGYPSENTQVWISLILTALVYVVKYILTGGLL